MLQTATPTHKPAAWRRAYKLLGLALILLTFAMALPAAASACIFAGGAARSTQGSGGAADLYGVAFSDATHGWAVGDAGAVLATADGGATWSKQSSGTTANPRAVAFSDATHGWAVGFGGAILATTDGGGAWSTQTSGSGGKLRAVAFSDATHGWAVGFGGAILATTDGGANWIAQTSGSSANLLAVTFIDATHGWAVGGGAIFATTDAGAVKFGAAKCTTYVSWSDTQIKCKAPAKARYGKVKVTVTTSAGTSNGVSFTVKK